MKPKKNNLLTRFPDEYTKFYQPVTIREIFDVMIEMFKPDLTDQEKEQEYQQILEDIKNNKREND